jgi:hypothetical protein
MSAPTMKQIAIAWCVTFGQIAWALPFAVLWVAAWIIQLFALGAALFTCGRWTIKPTSELFADLLYVPRRWCLGRSVDPKL